MGSSDIHMRAISHEVLEISPPNNFKITLVKAVFRYEIAKI